MQSSLSRSRVSALPGFMIAAGLTSLGLSSCGEDTSTLAASWEIQETQPPEPSSPVQVYRGVISAPAFPIEPPESPTSRSVSRKSYRASEARFYLAGEGEFDSCWQDPGLYDVTPIEGGISLKVGWDESFLETPRLYELIKPRRTVTTEDRMIASVRLEGVMQEGPNGRSLKVIRGAVDPCQTVLDSRGCVIPLWDSACVATIDAHNEILTVLPVQELRTTFTFDAEASRMSLMGYGGGGEEFKAEFMVSPALLSSHIPDAVALISRTRRGPLKVYWGDGLVFDQTSLNISTPASQGSTQAKRGSGE